jgi:hypothetical protein
VRFFLATSDADDDEELAEDHVDEDEVKPKEFA